MVASNIPVWLKRTVTGGVYGGLMSTAPPAIAVGAIKKDGNSMFLTGFLGLVGGACSKTIGEFLADYFGKEQKPDMKAIPVHKRITKAIALAFGFVVGGMVPLLPAFAFKGHALMTRLIMVLASVTLTLLMLGWMEARTGSTPRLVSFVKLLLPAWLTMAITVAMTKLTESP